MAEPVLVIHGVSNRRPEPFRAIVERLQKAVGDDVELVDVFWGDMGAATVGFEDTIPDAGAVGEEAVGGEAPTLLLPEDERDAARATAEERALVIAAAARPAGLETPDPVLYAVVLEQLQRTVHLRRMGSPEALAATGRLIAERAYAGAAAGAEEGPLKDLRDVVRRVMEEADRLVGAAVGEVLGRVNEEIRKRLVPTAAGFFGDVLAYEHHRAAIQQRVWEVVDARAPGRGTPGAPIHVAAHSLGGVIMFHAATGETDRTLAIDHFVTFGSQSSFFHCLDPRASGLAPYSPGNPVAVRSIRRWTNLWEPLDPLAFAAGKVFVLEDATGARTAVRDVRVRHLTDSGFVTHGSYWGSEELIDAIRDSG